MVDVDVHQVVLLVAKKTIHVCIYVFVLLVGVFYSVGTFPLFIELGNVDSIIVLVIIMTEI